MRRDQDEGARFKENAEKARCEYLDHEIERWFKDRNPEHGRYSEYARALHVISKAALKHAEATNAPMSGTDDLFMSLLTQGCDVVRELHCALRPDKKWVEENKHWLEEEKRLSLRSHWDNPIEEEKRKLKLWSHCDSPLNDVAIKKIPYFCRPEIEFFVGLYLALPYRASLIDRLLVDVLVAMELYQFANEMINEKVDHGLGPPRSPLKQTHPLKTYLKNAFYGLLSWTGIGMLVGLLHHLHVISDGWAWGGYITCALMYLLTLSMVTAFLPSAWIKHVRSVKQVWSLISEMRNCYSALDSDGPVSARHILERIKSADDKGAVWPAPLYALLDDVMARTGRLGSLPIDGSHGEHW